MLHSFPPQKSTDNAGDKPCLTHDLWTALSSRIDEFLSGVTLADLVAQRDVRHVAHRQDSDLIAARTVP